MNIENVKRLKEADNTTIAIKITKKEHEWYKSKGLSAGLIFKHALKELGFKGGK